MSPAPPGMDREVGAVKALACFALAGWVVSDSMMDQKGRKVKCAESQGKSSTENRQKIKEQPGTRIMLGLRISEWRGRGKAIELRKKRTTTTKLRQDRQCGQDKRGMNNSRMTRRSDGRQGEILVPSTGDKQANASPAESVCSKIGSMH